MERNIVDVMEQIKNEIPDDCQIRDTLLDGLESIKESALYTAPEANFNNWNRLVDLLGCYLDEPDNPWKQNIQKIMSGGQI
jgi:hypothetical protein